MGSHTYCQWVGCGLNVQFGGELVRVIIIVKLQLAPLDTESNRKSSYTLHAATLLSIGDHKY